MSSQHPQDQQPNTIDEHARAVEDYTAQIEARAIGEALDGVMATFTFETIRYAQSFAAGTWHPDRRTLFQIANQFPQN